MAGIVAYPVVAPEVDDLLLGTEIKEDGNLTKNFTVGSVVDLITSIIPAGPVGPQGPQGVQGIQGATGSQGIQGVQGNTGSQGVPGPVGPAGLEWRGYWVSGTSYIADDAVGYDGASYFCILATSGTTAPDLDTTHWALLAAEGLQGPAGATGTAGVTGPAGPQGIQGVQGIQGIAGPWGSITGNILSQTDLQNQFATYVPISRTITINGVTQDLSANRTWTVPGGGLVNSVFGRTGDVIATFGDYTTSLVTEGTNLYFTSARARTAITLTTTGTSGAATYNNVTGILNIPQYAPYLTGYVPYTGATQAVNLGAFNLLVNGISVGKGAGTGTNNTAIGTSALNANTIGGGNVAVGSQSLLVAASGFDNTAVGTNTLRSATFGGLNTAIGHSAMYYNTTGQGNVAVGVSALVTNTTGSNNVAIGPFALYGSVSTSNNTAIGYEALRSTNGGVFNTAVGSQSMRNNTTGNSNTAVGELTMFNNSTGGDNTAIGKTALYNNTAGINNTAIGSGAIGGLTSGSDNTVIGYVAMGGTQTGSSNVALGLGAGRYFGTGSSNNLVCNSSIFIGQNAVPLLSSQTNQIVIGTGAVGAGSNTVTLGNSSITKTFLRGQIYAGTSTPDDSAALQIDNGSKGFLPPRVTGTGSITAPIAGLIIYDSSVNILKCWNGTAWFDLF